GTPLLDAGPYRRHETVFCAVQHAVVGRAPTVVVDRVGVEFACQRVGDVGVGAGRQRVVGRQHGARRHAGTLERVVVARQDDPGDRGTVVIVEVPGEWQVGGLGAVVEYCARDQIGGEILM